MKMKVENTVRIEVMLNGKFVKTLDYRYCALFPMRFEDLTKFVEDECPSVRGKDYRIKFQEIKKEKTLWT